MDLVKMSLFELSNLLKDVKNNTKDVIRDIELFGYVDPKGPEIEDSLLRLKNNLKKYQEVVDNIHQLMLK